MLKSKHTLSNNVPRLQCVCPLLALFLMSVIVVTYNTTVIIIIIMVYIVYTLRTICPNNGRTFVEILAPISVNKCSDNDYFIFQTQLSEHLFTFFINMMKVSWLVYKLSSSRIHVNYLKRTILVLYYNIIILNKVTYISIAYRYIHLE